MGTGLLAWFSCCFFREGWEQWSLQLQWAPSHPHDIFHSGQKLLPMSHHQWILFSRALRAHNPSAMLQGGTLAQAQPVLSLQKPRFCLNFETSWELRVWKSRNCRPWFAGVGSWIGSLELFAVWLGHDNELAIGSLEPKPNDNEFKCVKFSLSS